MPAHQIPDHLVKPYTAGPTPAKISSVAILQNYIQELLGTTHHTFLQGSYKNDTAISDINDVDIVAVRLDTFSGVHSGYSFPQSIDWEQIFSEIETVLGDQKRYSWTVKRGDKCIKISGAFSVDVVPAVMVSPDHTADPICIYSFRDAVEKVSRPRIHYKNGVQKNQDTGERYKPMVRMFKNWAINHFGPKNEIISSHKIEALVYGAENRFFLSDPPSSFLRISHSILEKLDVPGGSVLSVCGHENILSNWPANARSNFETRLALSLRDGIDAYQARSVTFAEDKWKKALGVR